MKLKDYRKKAKELGGKVTMRTRHNPFTWDPVQWLHVITDKGVNISNADVWGKDFYETNKRFFDLEQEMKDDPELKAEGYRI